ncbi:hypothetical protein B0H13DRAFT_1867781 [Mycena leptocephala]|nr:hypothetical protein B0H13DRAFT_1867781 [Mycena leptocephala]
MSLLPRVPCNAMLSVLPLELAALDKERGDASNTNAKTAVLNPALMLLSSRHIVIPARFTVFPVYQGSPQQALPNFPLHAAAPNPPLQQPQLGRGRGVPVARGRGGAPAARHGHRPLAQPMAQDWVNQRQVVLREKGPDPKAERQRLEKLLQQTCTFYFYHTPEKSAIKLEHAVTTYPQMQLSATSLSQSIGMTANSWFDLYNYLELSWTTLQATAVFQIDKSRPTIIRIRPNLLTEIELKDCPGIEELLVLQPRINKRRLDDMVSPPKKVARTNVANTAHTRTVIEIQDSPPTSTASLPRILPSSTTVASTSTPAETPQKSWPAGYYVYEHAAAWIEHKRLQDEYGQNNVSLPASWPQLFPGSKFAHTTVTHWRKFWKNAPDHLKTRCIDAGRKQTGSWPYFVDAVRAHQEGRDQVFQDPIVTTEPNSTSIASQSAPDTPGLPQLNFDALIPLSPDLTLAPPPVIPEPPRNDCESCIFCDVEITIRPSPKLDQLLAEILPLTQPSPTPQNANHRTADSSRVYAAYCKQHETDSRLLPIARAGGWPDRIDYFGLRERVTEFLPMLQDLIDEVDASEFYDDALGGKFKKLTAYFGELGYGVIFNAIVDKFPAATISSNYAPLSWEMLVKQVLVPETIVSLISADLKVEHDDAVEILDASTQFGLSYHSDSYDRQRSRIEHSPEPELPQLPASSALPLSSPLRSPGPSPVLAPARWDLDLNLQTEPDTVDPALLCNYCDQLLPVVKSDKLQVMGSRLFVLSWEDPLPENALHRRTARITMTVEYCERHRFESVHLPKGLDAGWPLNPSFENIAHSLPGYTTKFFFEAARKHYKGKATQLQSVHAQYQSIARLAQQGVGYYGERGYQIFDHTLHFMFPDNSFDLILFYPLTYEMIIREVLIPEAAVRIVQTDLTLTAEAAATVIEASHTFGNVLHPADDDCPFLMNSLRLITQSNQRAQSASRSWQASGSELGFNEWVQSQKELLAVKSEPQEVTLTSTASTSARNAREIIDLTGDL